MNRRGREPAREPAAEVTSTPGRRGWRPTVQLVQVDRIRAEDGLSRRRDREGHRELCQSISRFGVLTPITVRDATDGGGYLLVKGQGRTLACRLLGIESIPAVVADDGFADTEKVQQFLVENVARLRMRPVDRALLIAHARERQEETAEVARRFGISAATVRRLQAQLDGAGSGEIAALRSGEINLALHGVIARYVGGAERLDIIGIVTSNGLRSQEVDKLFLALGWHQLRLLGPEHRASRVALFAWCCASLASLPKGQPKDRIADLAGMLPEQLEQQRKRHAT